jgi:lysophospholipase L1-like esterase
MPVVLCYGDSNTHGFDAASFGRLARDVRWPGVLAATLGDRWQVIEEGLNGRTTTWDDPFSEGRNGRTYLLPCLESHAPVDVVVVMLGTNDTKSILRLSAADIAGGASALVDVALASRCGPDDTAPRVLLVSPPPLGEATDDAELWGFAGQRAKSEDLARLYAVAARQAGVAFLDAGPLAEVDPADGVHLTRAGHRSLGLAVAEAVRELLR